MKRPFYSWIVMILAMSVILDFSSIQNVDAKWFQTPELEVHFLDVGQGDSALVLFPNGKKMLVDGGPRVNGSTVVNYLRQHNIYELDLVVSTHPDEDHLGGLLDVLREVNVKQVLDSGKSHTTDTYREYVELLNTKRIPIVIAKEGQTIHLDKWVNIDVLNSNNGEEDNNEASVVLKLTMGKIDYLLAADAEVGAESDMVRDYDLEAEILKAGHHGSFTSSTDPLLQEVKPNVTILSYGNDNLYGHPHKDVVERLKGLGTTMYSTAQSGSIIVKTNGWSYDISSIKSILGQLVSNEEPLPYEGKIAITKLDVKDEEVTIKNNMNEDVLMKGWKLISEAGNHVFHFPNNFVLRSGESVTVYSSVKGSKKKTNYLAWKSKRHIWKNVGDKAILYNPYGGIADFEGFEG
ncbi:MBL fold metallo-hydrolase [Bacillus sp. BGMRC 2118]|nr:MBL fold metallo-hydrolase [Bacillus sp. BGMRC 2118]